MRKGLGLGKGRGYYNIAHLDSHIHSLSAKGIKSKQLYACKKNELKAMGQMSKFKIDKEYSVVAWSEGTSRGFRHVAVLMSGGREVEKVTANYLNRTWESYTFQSVISKLLDKYFDEDEARKKMARLEEHKKSLFAKSKKQFMQNPQGEYMYIFDWGDGGWNSEWAKTKSEAINKAEKNYGKVFNVRKVTSSEYNRQIQRDN